MKTKKPKTFTAEVQFANQRREFVHNATRAVELDGYVRVDVRHARNGLIPAITVEHWYGPGARLLATHHD